MVQTANDIFSKLAHSKPLQNFQQRDQVQPQREVQAALLENPAAAQVLLSPVTGLTPPLMLWIGDTTSIKCFLGLAYIYIHIGTA